MSCNRAAAMVALLLNLTLGVIEVKAPYGSSSITQISLKISFVWIYHATSGYMLVSTSIWPTAAAICATDKYCKVCTMFPDI